MKVAFIGTHGCGKTTLSLELAALLKKQSIDADLVKEVARSCPLPINQDTSARAQLWILHSQIAREIESEAQAALVVCDRSVVDNYAYLHHAEGPHAAAERLVHDWIPTYDLLLRVPVRGRLQGDGVRDTDPGFQREVDQTIAKLLDQWKVPHVSLAGLPRNRWIGVARSAVLAALAGEPPPEPASSGSRSQLDLFASAE